MANKRINDLQARSDFDATCNVPVDDASQSWRVTGAQILAYIQANIVAAASWITALTADADPASGDHVMTYDLSGTALKKVTLANLWKNRVRTVTTTDTATAEDDTILVDGSGGAFTQSLPTAVGIKGKRYTFKAIATGIVTLDGATTETIDGSTTLKLCTSGDYVTIESDNANWRVVDKRITVCALFGNSSNLSVSTATTVWPVESLDTHGAYDHTTGVFTVPPGEGGIYEVGGSNLTLTGAGTIAIAANLNSGTDDYFGTYGGTGTVFSGSTRFNAAAGDTIRTKHSGSNTNAAGSRLFIRKVS